MSVKKKDKKQRQPEIIRKEANTAVPRPGFWRENMIPLLILFVIPFLLYGYSISFDYVLDDKIVLSENNFVRKGLSGIKDIFTTESFTGYLGEQQDLVMGARYRPLSIAMFAVEYEFFGLNTKVGHFINILLYALTGLLLFRILTIFLPIVRGKKWYYGLPFISALLYVVHPLHTEVVANIKSRDEILALLLSLAALFYTYRFTVTGKLYWLVVSPFIFLLALLAKESSITFIAVVPITLYYFTNTSIKKIALASSPLILSALIYIGIRYQVIGYLLDSGKEITGLMNNPFLGTSIAEKYATIVYTLGLYIKLMIFPHPLTHDYYPYQIPILDWGDIKVWASLVPHVVMIGYALFTFKKKTIPGWSIWFYLITLSIVSNLFFPIGTFMNERFVYMPSVGFTVLVSYWILESIPKIFEKIPALSLTLTMGLLALLIAGYSYKTVERVPAWKDEMSLNRAAAKVSVNSARANQFMGYGLYRKGLELQDREEKRKIFDEATYYVDRALSIHSTYPDALTSKAGLMAGYYQLDQDLEKLLNGFYTIQMTNPIPFVDTYLDYLDKRADQQKMAVFYQKLGSALKQKGNTAKGNYYLRKAGK